MFVSSTQKIFLAILLVCLLFQFFFLGLIEFSYNARKIIVPRRILITYFIFVVLTIIFAIVAIGLAYRASTSVTCIPTANNRNKVDIMSNNNENIHKKIHVVTPYGTVRIEDKLEDRQYIGKNVYITTEDPDFPETVYECNPDYKF